MLSLSNLFAFRSVAVVQDDDTEYDPPVRAIVISEDDVTVAIKNDLDATVSLVVPAVADGAKLPFIWPCGNARKILATGTTAADANLIALQG